MSVRLRIESHLNMSVKINEIATQHICCDSDLSLHLFSEKRCAKNCGWRKITGKCPRIRWRNWTHPAMAIGFLNYWKRDSNSNSFPVPPLRNRTLLLRHFLFGDFTNAAIKQCFFSLFAAAGSCDHSPGVELIPPRAEWRWAEAEWIFSSACSLIVQAELLALQKGTSFGPFLRKKRTELCSAVQDVNTIKLWT